MKERTGKSTVFAAILLSSVSLPCVAHAQWSTAPMPVRTYIDENGVDLFSGKRIIQGPTLVAGPDDRLSYYEIWSSPGNINHSVQGVITTSGSLATVSIGATSEKFSIIGSNQYQSVEARGSTLTYGSGGWIYTTSDGTIYTFQRDNSCCQAVYRQWGDVPTIRSIKYKDGLLLTYNWATFQITVGQTPSGPLQTEVKRVAAIYSNSGFALNFTYKNNPSASSQDFNGAITIAKVIANNTSLDGCSNGVCTAINRPHLLVGYLVNGGRSNTDRVNQTTTITSPTVQYPTENVSYSYDGANRVTSATARGVTTNYGYSDVGDIRSVTVSAAGDPPRTLTFNIAQATLRSDTDETNRTTSYEYDSSARVKKISSPENNFTALDYDGRGNVVTISATGKDGSTLSTSSTFPCAIAAACNSPASTTDARGNVTNFDYDPSSGLLTKITEPAATNGVRPERRIGYTQIGGIWRPSSISQCNTTFPGSCIGTSDETRIAATYTNSTGLPASITVAVGDNSISAMYTRTYDAMGRLLTVDGPLAGAADTTRYYYDDIGRTLGTVGPDPDDSGPLLRRAVRNTYNSAGQLILVETGTATNQSDGALANIVVLQSTSTSYDSSGRTIAQSASSGGSTFAHNQTSYDTRGRVECVVERMNPSAFTSTSNACALGPQGSFGPDRISKTSYDAASRVVSVVTSLGTSDAATVSTSYTQNGQPANVTDGEGNRTTYEFDGHDRLKKTRYPDPSSAGVSSTTDYEELGYDAGSNVTSRRLRDGQTVTYGYDALNRLTSKATPGSVTGDWDVTYAYDLLGRLTQASGDGWAGNTFGYDAFGRLVTQQSHDASTYHAYDLAGRRTRVTWSDAFHVDYDYNVTGEVTAIRENGATSGPGLLATYVYDNLGRRTSVTRGNGTVTSYGYDGVSRLSSLTQNLAGTGYDFTHSFSYNPASQIASMTRSNDAYAWNGHYNVDRPYTVNGLNQVTAAGSVGIGYDGRGNLTSSGASAYTYTTENRMRSGPGAAMMYQPATGQLLQLYNTSTGADTRFVWSGDQMVSEITAPGGVIARRYVPGPGVDEPVAWYEGSGTSDRRWLHADERGSIVAVSDGAGNAIAINRYDEYGIPASGNVGRFQYTGQAWLPELGIYYYKARMYSPTLGRFMQTDPIEYGDGLNLYAYVGNDPVNFTDPSGLKCAAGQLKVFTRDGSPAVWRNGEYVVELGYTCVSSPPASVSTRGNQGRASNGSQPQSEPSTLENVWACTKDHYGFGEGDSAGDAAAGVGRATSEALAIPIPKEAFGMRRHPGTSSTTNVLNAISHKTRIGAGVNIPGQAGQMAGRVFGSARLLTVVGRANMVTGALFALYDAGSIAYCTYKKEQ